MKKMLLLLFFLAGFSPAFAWVFTAEAVNLDRKSILLSKLLSGRPLGVCIHLRHSDGAAPCPSSFCADMHASTRALFEASYQHWFDSLKNTIVRSGRTKEFADILALISKQPTFTYYNGADNHFAACDYHTFKEDFANIDLILMPFLHLTQWGPGAAIEGGHYNKSGNPQEARAKATLDFHYRADDFGLEGYPLVNGQKKTRSLSGSNRSSFHIMTHELGHSLGLGDLYAEAINKKYNSRLYTTHHLIPGPQTPSIMNRSMDLTCDDMDGLVNLMDHYFADTRLKKSVRRQKGWVSLCENRNIAYAYGMPFSVTDEEKARYRLFSAQAYVGGSLPPAPCQEKVRRIYAQTAQAKQEEQARQVVADSLAQVHLRELEKQETQAMAARINQYNQHALVCPVCGKKVLYGEDKYPYNAQVGGVAYQMHIHRACDAQLAHIKVTASTFKKYGKALN